MSETPAEVGPAPADRLTEAEAGALREAIAEAVLAARPAGRKGLGNDPAAHLLTVDASRVAAEETSRLLRQSINGARAAGHSWEAVGGLLGISRQAAQQRFGAAPARGAAGAAEQAAPGEPAARRRVLSPLNAFNEMQALAQAGRHGWHVVDYGHLHHLVESSPHQWEHQRLWWPTRRRRQRMAERGWELVTPSHFESPWAYYKRPLDLPAEPGLD
ncbi:hypothetical protein [Streptomyces hoynatensis]|uniref:Uncharacterized protein n=1 Tax=Streptomyces hoynatensis TaxID=1141874 RepID=A0A3A9YWW4_9ACTN|nr:hypothetical protein [Streptomyces hoynatensis]RKN39716.1 hypothetical protein D7294_19935 [Streptomyces hoynatensis]